MEKNDCVRFVRVSTGGISSTVARTAIRLKVADSRLRCRILSGKDANFLKVKDGGTMVGTHGGFSVSRGIIRFLSSVFSTVGVRMRVLITMGRRRRVVRMRLGKSSVKVLVNGEKRALSSLRCLAGLTVGGRSSRCCGIGVSARSCEGEEGRALRGLTGGVTCGMGHAGHPISLRPVGPFREQVVRSTLRGSHCIAARDRKSRPCHRMIMALGGWKAS